MPDRVFKEAPEEVMRYFDAKGTQPSFDWRDFAPNEHAFAFTVAKSAGFDILDDVRAATRDAIANYTTYGDFVNQLMPTLRMKGWWGRKVVDGPNGKQLVQFGSLRRLRTIYWANVNTARAAGEWERIQRTKRGLPFLVYELSVAERRRPEHLQWVGVILPVDDAFWITHYPPNGWLCQCRVRQISRREAEVLGYDATAAAPQVVTRPWTNKVTGERFNVPEGIDPGWQSNPGATRADNLRRFLSDRLDALPQNARRIAVRDLVGQKHFQALARAELPYDGANDRSPANIERGRMALPVAILPEHVRKLIGAKTRTVLLSNHDAHKQVGKRPQVDPKAYAIVQQMAEGGTVYEDATSEVTFALQMMIEGEPWTGILRLTKDQREVYLKSLRRIRPEQFGPTSRNIPMD
ncbi:phage minor head protein [Cognatishimia sp. MH4019]|uniref:phage head morphogenesis protein n=1 Tax=Cognatishimia sp. MH4019 TaxID=2854030 RepID=UPI001CD33545|nr:phage minor head protein [Cognatishimia sp. MH4019]